MTQVSHISHDTEGWECPPPPSMLWLFFHTLTGCWLQVCSLNMGVSA